MRIGPLIEHRGEDLPPVFVGGDEPLGIGSVHGNRFFHHHVQPGAKRGPRSAPS